MARTPRPAFLKLVHSTGESTPSQFQRNSEGQAQGIFFPSSNPNTLIFLAWGRASADDLLDVFELSKPKLIFDLRVAPRFDLGLLTRKRFFELLRQHNCQYIDLFGRMGIENINDALVNPVLVGAQVITFTEKLPIPNNGPFVFLHDDDFFDDKYIGELAKSLPSLTSEWQVYRPMGSTDRVLDKSSESRSNAGTGSAEPTPLQRRTIFISHATPEDNAFVAWLASKLSIAGYEVWSDISDLNGGDGFWANIEDVIRLRAAKVLFVHSSHVKQKAGTRKEVYLALKVGDRHRIPRFVIPMRIDRTPFEETLIELIDIQSIDCQNDWLVGLKSLLSLLQRDGVPRAVNFRADQFSRLVTKFDQPTVALLASEELVVSNWLRIASLPEYINFFSCRGLSLNHLAEVAAQLSIPASAYYTHVLTFATRERLLEALAKIGLDAVQVGERARLPWSDFLAGRWGDLPSVKGREARSYAFGLLHQAWTQFVDSRGPVRGTLANKRLFWFFTNQHFPKNEVRFSDFSGRSVRRQLVGFSEKRKVYWHFGVQARCGSAQEAIHFSVSPHVTFSADGKTPLSSKAQLHSLRRSFCRSWWNNRWRDLSQGFISGLAAGDNVLKVDVGSESFLQISAAFEQMSCPVTLAKIELPEKIDDFAGEDHIEDQWEDDVYDESDIELEDQAFPSPHDDPTINE
jgi:hypothetical protein